MQPVGQSSSRSVKNDTLTPVQTAGAVCGAVSAAQGGGDSRGVSFSTISKLCLY